MQYDTLNKVKILLHDEKANVEKYIPLKDVVLFIDSNKEITLGDFLASKDKELSNLKEVVKAQGKAIAKLTDVASKLNLKI